MAKNLKKEAEVKARKAIAEAEKKFAHVKKSMDAHIKEEPEKAVLVAAAVGAAIGAIATLAITHRKKE
ncbi:MAG: hypothetical protein WCT31_00025 [Candidatus Micrarchaeia archaeon]|jgi:ElaB/YqjD/DUF883 family membrane-anchored ribosome-binding protein